MKAPTLIIVFKNHSEEEKKLKIVKSGENSL